LLQFIEGAGQLLAICEDNSLHLLQVEPFDSSDVTSNIRLLASDFSQVNVDDSEEARTAERHQITSLLYIPGSRRVLLGDACGQIIALQVDSFEVEADAGLRTEQVIQALPEDQRRTGSLGAIEALAARPHHPNQILIGYNRGVIVLWNLTTNEIENVFITAQRLESVSWLPCGQRIVSAHNDGSYVGWNLTDSPLTPSEPANTAYGPFPCKPINKLYAYCDPDSNEDGEQLLVFGGGLPRQSYCLRYTVSVVLGPLNGTKHKAFDFTSKVIDFVVIEKSVEGEPTKKVPEALIVLADEELVVIDLQHPDWLQFRLPYLVSVHLSPITCCHALSGVGSELIEQFKQIGDSQNDGKFSSNSWPVRGGELKGGLTRKEHELLITGHEDGSVRLWDVTGSAMVPLCSLDTSKLFSTLDDDIAMVDEEDEEWPPFRRVGVFDPYTDDPRLGVRKVLLCARTGALVVAGTAGQLLVYQLSQHHNPITLNPITINLVGDCDGFVWKSHDKLSVRSGTIEMPSGFQPKGMAQLWPPAAVSALALHSEWGLVAVGTGHGFAVFDYVREKQLCVRCTLNPADVFGVGSRDALITRRKSFKKSLRESFRRLRRSKSQRQTKKGGVATTSAPSLTSPTSPGSPAGAGAFKRGGLPSAAAEEDWHSDSKPVERQIEAKGEDGLGSVVRCVHFSSAPVSGNSSKPVPSLWAGTNAGRVFVYTLELPTEAPVRSTSTPVELQGEFDEPAAKEAVEEKTVLPTNSTEEPSASTSEPTKAPVTSVLAKEIQLKHHAPVIFIHTVDASGRPCIDLQEATDKSHVPKVLICSEEQFKLFQLPSLKALGKFKLTAHEGSKARRLHISEFVSATDPAQRDFAIACACNQGLIGAYSVLDLRRQLQANYTKKEDINGICSLVFADNGDGFFLSSPSEFVRFSLAAGKALRANCSLQIDAQLRVKPIGEQKAEEESKTEQILESNLNVPTTETAPQTKESEIPKDGNPSDKDNVKETSEQVKDGEESEKSAEKTEESAEGETKESVVESKETESEPEVKHDQQVESEQVETVAETLNKSATEEHEQTFEDSTVEDTAEQLQALSLDADDTANGSELFEDSKADEDTIIDHIEVNGRHSASSHEIEPQSNGTKLNGTCENGDHHETNGICEKNEEITESEEKKPTEESKGKVHKSLELTDDVHSRLLENCSTELKSL
jgi:lethal(2) giant larvae protein